MHKFVQLVIELFHQIMCCYHPCHESVMQSNTAKCRSQFLGQ